MSIQKLAIKKLTRSDLSVFHWHLHNKATGKQKAINLNASVFIDEFYPDLPDLSQDLTEEGVIELGLYIYGPGLTREYYKKRKIIKRISYKNWRLNGKLIHNPDHDPGRFNCLDAGDYVILWFIGDSLPEEIMAVFICRETEADRKLHEQIAKFMRGESMKSISDIELESLVGIAEPSQEHPIYEILLNADLEDASQGGFIGIRNLSSHRENFPRINRQELERARKNATIVGHSGEEIINQYLSNQQKQGIIDYFIWESDINAISPYDFLITEKDNLQTLIDVKSTSSDFNNRIHISYSELLCMQETENNYYIYRVYDITRTSAKLRITRNLAEFAGELLSILEMLPDGIYPDSISISPKILPFEDPAEILLSMLVLEE